MGWSVSPAASADVNAQFCSNRFSVPSSSKSCRALPTTLTASFGRRAFPSTGVARFGTWNVEGLTDIKIHMLQRIMRQSNIGVLCLQETHRCGSDYWITEDGYLVILSGVAEDVREYAGVGFLISPRIRPALLGFLQVSNRICCLKHLGPLVQVVLVQVD